MNQPTKQQPYNCKHRKMPCLETSTAKSINVSKFCPISEERPSSQAQGQKNTLKHLKGESVELQPQLY